jgi:nucleotide-binding universal stress UspA family protein
MESTNEEASMREVPSSATKRRIVVGIDGSEAASRALRWAAEEAAERSAELEIVHVWERPQVYAPMGVGAYPIDPETVREAARNVLDRAVSDARALAPEVRVRDRLEEGAAGTVLVDAAHEAELLVVGSRGLSGLRRLFLGSVSQQVAHHASCPVVIVPDEHRTHPADES